MPDVRFKLREDCFGCKGGGCVVLSEALCVTTGWCAFYKTREQAQKCAEKAHTAATERGYYLLGSKYSPNGGGQA